MHILIIVGTRTPVEHVTVLRMIVLARHLVPILEQLLNGDDYNSSNNNNNNNNGSYNSPLLVLVVGH